MWSAGSSSFFIILSLMRAYNVIIKLNSNNSIIMLEIYFLPYERSLIHVRHNSGDLNDLASKVWDFFPKTATFRTPN